jgi:hypothetical protein
MAKTLKSIGWKWDTASGILWANIAYSDGTASALGIPLAQVVATFERHASELGLVAGPYVAGVDSVEGFFSSVRKMAKKATKTVKKAVKKTQKTLAKGIKAAGKAAGNKYLKGAVAGLAVAFPAVGGPALAALTAANAAYATYQKADSALSDVRRLGKQTASAARAISRGQNVATAARRLASQRSPLANMAKAALRSVPANSVTTRARTIARTLPAYRG